MKLEEAIDTLKNEICDYVIPNYCNDCKNKSECLDDCNFILSIYTVLQEIEHLQKENEEYSKQLDLDYVDKNFVSKDKIRKKIKQMNTEEKIKLKNLGGTDRYLTKLEYMHKQNILEDLLKEE